MVNAQQIIVYLPLFNISCPANIGLLFNVIMKIAAFDIVTEIDEINEDIWHLDETEPLTPNFEAVGFETLWFIYNLGSITLVALVVILLMISVPFLTLIGKRYQIFAKASNYLKKELFWNTVIRGWTESYAVLTISCMLNILNLKWNSWGSTINSGLALIIQAILVLFPLIAVYYLNKFFDLLRHKSFVNHYGSFYDDKTTTRGKLMLLYPFLFYLRRFLLSFCVIYTVKTLSFQIFVMQMTIVF